MTKDEAEKVVELSKVISQMEDIKRATEKEKSHWWKFATPDTVRHDEEGLWMPDILRDEFVKSVDKCLEKLNKELEEL